MNRVYRAKKPAFAGAGFVNDRQILWIGSEEVQYDGPSVARGRHYPKVSRAKFEAWAQRDVTDELPKDEWQTWDSFRNEKAKK